VTTISGFEAPRNGDDPGVGRSGLRSRR